MGGLLFPKRRRLDGSPVATRASRDPHPAGVGAPAILDRPAEAPGRSPKTILSLGSNLRFVIRARAVDEPGSPAVGEGAWFRGAARIRTGDKGFAVRLGAAPQGVRRGTNVHH